MPLTQVRTILDFLVRLAFFAATPFLLVVVASLFPVTGAIVQIGIALAAFFTGEALRRLMTRSKLIKLALSGQLQFEAYYRTHKPRPFLYYVFYPVLFPYWAMVHEARQEFLLYKGYTLATFALLVVSQVVGYWRYFPPELGAREFLPLAAGSFLVETAVVLMFLMPIVTSVVHFHTLRAPRRLVALLVIGLVSVSLAVVRIERRRDPVVSYATRQRVDMRTHARPRDAEKTLIAALRESWKVLPKDKGDVEHDGKVEGDVLAAAQDALVGFYKNDEAHAFDLWYTRRGKGALLVLYFEARGKNEPIWEAMDGHGNALHDSKQLPPGAFNAMWRMTQ